MLEIVSKQWKPLFLRLTLTLLTLARILQGVRILPPIFYEFFRIRTFSIKWGINVWKITHRCSSKIKVIWRKFMWRLSIIWASTSKGRSISQWTNRIVKIYIINVNWCTCTETRSQIKALLWINLGLNPMHRPVYFNHFNVSIWSN